MKLKKISNNAILLQTNHGQEILYSFESPVAGYLPNIGYFKINTEQLKETQKHMDMYLADRENIIPMCLKAIERIFKI